MKQIELLSLLRKSHKICQIGLQELDEKYKSLAFHQKIQFALPSSFAFDFQKNFFTLLMISILIKTEIAEERIISYGKIIFCLRNIVTSTDNIIDKEDKNLTKIQGISNPVANNVFNLLLHQTILFQELEKLSLDSSSMEKILEEFLWIAESKGNREVALYQEYPSVKEVEEKIHTGIGGKLLQIALTLPLQAEKNKVLEEYNRGLFEIGMSLQALDDLMDIEEDFKEKKINLAVAFQKEQKDISQEIWEENYLAKTLQRAFTGFQILEKEGYPIDHKTSIYLLKNLFILRGVDKKYLNIFKKL